MSQIYNVKEGATLSCSLGSCTSKLQIPKGHGASIQGKNEACIMDNQVGVNIMPFGTCAKTNPTIP